MYFWRLWQERFSTEEKARGTKLLEKKLVTKYEYEMTKHKEAKEEYDSYQVTTRKIIKCFTLAWISRSPKYDLFCN